MSAPSDHSLVYDHIDIHENGGYLLYTSSCGLSPIMIDIVTHFSWDNKFFFEPLQGILTRTSDSSWWKPSCQWNPAPGCWMPKNDDSIIDAEGITNMRHKGSGILVDSETFLSEDGIHFYDCKRNKMCNVRDNLEWAVTAGGGCWVEIVDVQLKCENNDRKLRIFGARNILYGMNRMPVQYSRLLNLAEAMVFIYHTSRMKQSEELELLTEQADTMAHVSCTVTHLLPQISETNFASISQQHLGTGTNHIAVVFRWQSLVRNRNAWVKERLRELAQQQAS